MWNLVFLFTGMFFIFLLLCIFLSKEVVENKENKTFKLIAIFNLIGYISEISLQLSIRGLGADDIVSIVLAKVYLVIIFIWFSIFSIYTFIIGLNKDNEEKYNKQFNIQKTINSVIGVIGSILLIGLPIKIFYDGTRMYSFGLSVDVLKILLGIYLVSWIGILIFNIKKLRDKRFIPMFVVVGLLIVNVILSTIDPGILISTMVGTFVCYTMFFTIENPDLKLLRQMEFAKDQAERANRAKSDFLSSMSHEIRTPLNAIVGLSEDNINYEDKCPPEVVENSKDIMTASQTLLEIVGNILDINKIEANKMEIVESPYNFVKEVSDMCKITQTRIGEKNVIFHLNMAEDIPYELIGDKAKVKEIINNLLTNAIKYTEQGNINLNIRCINDIKKNISKLIITCQDTGRGIKAENISKLFTKFERLDIEKNSTTEGTGLGLAITKALVEMMGGNINVQSQFGQGSIFMVQIPQKISIISNPMTIQTTSKPSANSVSSSIEYYSHAPEQANSVQTTSSSNPSNVSTSEANLPRYGNKKILIVDDNNLNIKVARRALTDFNFEIEECYDGQQCLDKVKVGNEYDLILMDIMMPNMSGETAIARLKENPNFKIPTIALTADAVAGAEEKYKSEGFIDYIAKPFKKEQIQEKLDKIFGPVKSDNIQVSPEPIAEKKDEVFNALSDMTKPIQEIELPNNVNMVHETDSSVDRFKDVEVHVITDNTNKNEGNE